MVDLARKSSKYVFFLEATVVLLFAEVFYAYFLFNCPKYKKELRFNAINNFTSSSEQFK